MRIFAILLVLLLACLAAMPKKAVAPQSLIAPSTNNFSTPLQVTFIDQAIEWRLYEPHISAGKISGLDETLGSGVCVFDANNDGWEDVLLIGGGGEHRHLGSQSWWGGTQSLNRLYLNKAGHYFEDVTQHSKILTKNWPMGCTTGDLDNDGDQDIIITNKGANQLFLNNGNATFIDASTQASIGKLLLWSTSTTLTDVNSDGLLDIYIGNYIDYDKARRVFEADSGVKTTASTLSPSSFAPQPNSLLINQGGAIFKELNTLGTRDNNGRTLSVLTADFNRDGKQDLLSINDTGSQSRLFLNNYPAVFLENSAIYNIEDTSGYSSVAAAQLNDDDTPDLLLASVTGARHQLLVSDTSKRPITYRDDTSYSGLETLSRMHSNSVAFADFNNDNILDLIVANGSRQIHPFTAYQTIPQPITFFLGSNTFKPHFIPKTSQGITPTTARGLASGDFNNDGKVDFIISANNTYPTLLINNTNTSRPWVGISIDSRGYASIGAKVELQTNRGTLHQFIQYDGGFLSKNSDRLRFNLALGTTTANATIIWPDGITRTYQDLKTGYYYTLDRAGKTQKIPAASPKRDVNQPKSNQFFISLDIANKTDFIKRYGQFIVAGGTHNISFEQYLLAEFRSFDALTRIAIIEASYQFDNVGGLVIAKAAILNGDTKETIAALHSLKKQESELSIPWIIKALNSPNAQIVCAAAELLTHFLNEEEAVIRNKGTTIPALIKQLSQQADDALTCLLRTLAAAEHFRAVPAIKQLMSSSESDPIKIEAVTALGNIREQQSEYFLLDLLKSKANSPELIAATLVALHRLSTPTINTLIDEFTTPNESSNKPLLTAAVLFNNHSYRLVTGININSALTLAANAAVTKQSNLSRADSTKLLRLIEANTAVTSAPSNTPTFPSKTSKHSALTSQLNTKTTLKQTLQQLDMLMSNEASMSQKRRFIQNGLKNNNLHLIRWLTDASNYQNDLKSAHILITIAPFSKHPIIANIINAHIESYTHQPNTYWRIASQLSDSKRTKALFND